MGEKPVGESPFPLLRRRGLYVDLRTEGRERNEPDARAMERFAELPARVRTPIAPAKLLELAKPKAKARPAPRKGGRQKRKDGYPGRDACGISRRTWYRREKKLREKTP